MKVTGAAESPQEKPWRGCGFPLVEASTLCDAVEQGRDRLEDPILGERGLPQQVPGASRHPGVGLGAANGRGGERLGDVAQADGVTAGELGGGQLKERVGPCIWRAGRKLREAHRLIRRIERTTKIVSQPAVSQRPR